MPRTLEKRRSIPSAVHFNYIKGRLGRFPMMSEAFIAKFTYSFFCLRELRHFFCVAGGLRLCLFIDISLSSKQHNTCKVLCLQSKFCLHSDWCGPHGELTACKLVWMGVNRPGPQSIQSGMGICEL